LLGTSAANQAAIFGVTVAQVPTCSDTDVLPDGTVVARNVNPGKFQLLIQTGSATIGTGGKAEAAGTTTGGGAAAIPLPKLATPARIEAWAALVE